MTCELIDVILLVKNIVLDIFEEFSNYGLIDLIDTPEFSLGKFSSTAN